MMIYPSEITWEAAATFASGFAAVAAAWFVASRQLKILDRQLELEETNLRERLFERRHEVYKATQRWLAQILREANDATDEATRDFLLALDSSKFLFRPSVHAGLNDLWKLERQRHLHHASLQSARGAAYQKHVDGESDSLEALGIQLTNLSDIFGDAMKLWSDDTLPGKRRWLL